MTTQRFITETIDACAAHKRPKLVLKAKDLETIPESVFAQCQHLVELDISGNYIEEIPSALESLRHLEKLDVSKNKLRTLPDAVTRLPNLQKLRFANNYIQGLPEDIGRCNKLEVLFGDDNDIDELPKSITGLQNLRQLALDRNRLTCLPGELGCLKRLEKLELDSNRLEALPHSIVDLKRLQVLDVSNNDLITFAEEILDLPLLEKLYADANRLPDDTRVQLNAKKRRLSKPNFHFSEKAYKPQHQTMHEFDFFVLTALKRPEFECAMEALSDAWAPKKLEVDGLSVSVAMLSHGGIDIKLGLATVDDMGMAKCAARVARLIHFVQTKYLVMTGICAGNPDDSTIGDVIFADQTRSYDFGKLISRNGTPQTKLYPDDQRPRSRTAIGVAKDAADDQLLKARVEERALELVGPKKPLKKDLPVKVHVGLLGSGAKVISSTQESQRILESSAKMLGYEMEAHAVLKTVNEYSNDASKSPVPLVVKSVADFGDDFKSRNKAVNQRFAALTSALFVRELIPLLFERLHPEI